jgi:hypothetical protein
MEHVQHVWQDQQNALCLAWDTPSGEEDSYPLLATRYVDLESNSVIVDFLFHPSTVPKRFWQH